MAAELGFDEFYDASFRRVVGQVFAMVGSLTEAEDSVQEGFARAWQNWSRISAYEDPEAWVRGVAFRLSVSSWRKAVNRFTAHQRQANPGGETLSGLSRTAPPSWPRYASSNPTCDRSSCCTTCSTARSRR